MTDTNFRWEKPIWRTVCAVPGFTAVSLIAGLALAATGTQYTYTTTSDFNEGTRINVTADVTADQLQLIDQGEPFEFIWVAASGRGTIVKIDTVTGEVLGEYLSAPSGRYKNPSRTTVDSNGNVWAGNRDEAMGGKGSIVHVGLVENGQCVDRNGNGSIDTSSGLNDIKPWPNTGGADDDGGVSTAEDECILHYVRTLGNYVRTLAVDANNDVWVGGYGYPRTHQKIDGDTGLPVAGTEISPNLGGYGGLMDGNGVLWSASFSPSYLFRYDTTTLTATSVGLGKYSYGLGIDANGNVWHSNWTYNTVMKIAPDGAILGTFNVGGGGTCSRGVAVTPVDNDVWVANSCSNNVSRLGNDGAFKMSIPVGNHPTGVAVDAAGKVWVTNYNSHNVMRIDPATNSVDLAVDLGSGAYPYNYSDMTGSTLLAPPDDGTWRVVHDSGLSAAPWRNVSWNTHEPGDSSITVQVESSDDGATFGSPVNMTNGGNPAISGRYLRVTASFARSTNSMSNGSVYDSPVLYDLTVVSNRPPDCSSAYASVGTLWPPNHKFVPISVLGVTDPDGDAFVITIHSIFQDEPVDGVTDYEFTSPDGTGVGTTTASVRAERLGSPEAPGDGRFYHIGFTASDSYGGTCTGSVKVTVPHDETHRPVDGGALYDSTLAY